MRVVDQKKTERQTEYVTLEEDASDMWRAYDLVEELRDGGVGVVPTDVGYAFVTTLRSRQGVQRILDMIDVDDPRKPLSLLCPDLAAIEKYTKGIDKFRFKLIKKALPGPYTFILQASSELPRVYIKSGKRRYKRETVGVRMPDDPVVLSILEQLGEPLLGSTVPVDPDLGEQLVCTNIAKESPNWCREVDFVIDAGMRPLGGDKSEELRGSTIYDLSGDEIEILREGQGPLLQ
jgi:tRNA threonylcarbamoyl adenosine modification protein (Sua5/YciO/YrdC/YwlC family)